MITQPWEVHDIDGVLRNLAPPDMVEYWKFDGDHQAIRWVWVRTLPENPVPTRRTAIVKTFEFLTRASISGAVP